MVEMGKISDWLQVAGMFGVMASLVFVGLQMKQTQEIALSSIYQSRSDTTVEMTMAATNSPDVLSVLTKSYSGHADQLSMREAVAFEHYLGATVTMLENNHRQFEAGFLPEEHWQRNLQELKCALSSPVRRQMIMSWPYSESFTNVLRQVAAESDGRQEDCWVPHWDFVTRE